MGRFWAVALIAVVAAAVIATTAWAAADIEETPISTAAGDQEHPAISGNIVVWQDHRNEATTGWDISGYDLSTHTEFPICTASGDQVAPAVSGDKVVWQDGRDYSTTGWDIYGYDIPSTTEFPVCTQSGDQENPAISGSIVVWQDARNAGITGWDIWAYDLVADQEFPTCMEAGDQECPAVSSALVVWQDSRNLATTGWDIYCYNLLAAEESPLCVAWGDQHSPATCDPPAWYWQTVAWMDEANSADFPGNADVCAINIGVDATGTTVVHDVYAVCTQLGNQTDPVVSDVGAFVIWSDERAHASDPTQADIYAVTIQHTELPGEITVCAADGRQAQPAVSGSMVAWADTRSAPTSGSDIYAGQMHRVWINPTPNPYWDATVEGGGTILVSSWLFDTLGHTEDPSSWFWEDGGAGGTFVPSANVWNPTYVAPLNPGDSSFPVIITATAACNGPAPLADTQSFALIVLPTTHASQGHGASLPTSLTWDSVSSASVTATNTGLLPWTPGDGYALAGDESKDRWGVFSVAITSEVAPEDDYAFEFAVTAPPLTTLTYATPVLPSSTPGAVDHVDCAWTMAKEGEEFGPTLASSDVVISRFPDIQPATAGAWARSYVEECAGRVPLIVAGYDDGTYRPALAVDRGAMAVYMARALELALGHYEGRFSDVTESHWAWPWIEALVRAGIVAGYPDGTYRPSQLVNRGQMAVYVARGIWGGMDVPAGPEVGTFPDVPDRDPGPEHWAYDEIEFTVAHHVVQGYPDGTYRPDNEVTRDQMAVYVYRGFIQPTGAVVVLGGPAMTAVNPETAIYQGWSSLGSGPSDDPGYAYIVLDAARLGTGLTSGDGHLEITFRLAEAAEPSGSYTVSLSADDIAEAKSAACATGMPYLPVSWNMPADLPVGSYILEVSVQDEAGRIHEITRKPAFSITP